MLAELLAAGMNANLGGREHAAVYVERAVVAWFAELFGFPASASGILTSGTSMGNLLAVVAARDAALGDGARGDGIARRAARPRTRPRGVHDSVAKAMRIAGLGTRGAARDRDRRDGGIDVTALRARIAADRADGARPFLVIGTAGHASTPARSTTSTRWPISAPSSGCGCTSTARSARSRSQAPRTRTSSRGIERADSLAFDAHKWLHAPVRASAACCSATSARTAPRSRPRPPISARAERGAAAGAPWFTDYGLELSREFRALKVWFTLRHYGIDRLGASIARTCELAATLGERVRAFADLELLAPVTLNVVVLPRRAAGARRSGARPAERGRRGRGSGERRGGRRARRCIGGRRALRACIVNHRTREDDLDVLLDAVRPPRTRRARCADERAAGARSSRGAT